MSRFGSSASRTKSDTDYRLKEDKIAFIVTKTDETGILNEDDYEELTAIKRQIQNYEGEQQTLSAQLKGS